MGRSTWYHPLLKGLKFTTSESTYVHLELHNEQDLILSMTTTELVLHSLTKGDNILLIIFAMQNLCIQVYAIPLQDKKKFMII